MSIKEERLRDILNRVAVKWGMKNWRFKIKENSETIETYFGVLIPLTMIGVFEDKEISQRVFVKLPCKDELLRTLSAYMWDAEVYVYGTLVPLWERLSDVKLDELIPQCYYADATPNNQILVLEDMRPLGFQKYKGIFLDSDHVTVSLKSLAEIHALSLIVKKDHGELMANVLLRPYTHTYPLALNNAILKSFRAHFQLFKGSKYEHYWKGILANYETIVTDSISKAKCLVYGHGDYWKDNILYKYENGNPVKACTLDFQAYRLMTPAYDFLYFILNSTNGSLRRLQYENFLNEYCKNIQSVLFDHGIEMLFKKEDFICDMKIVASLCFIRLCLAFSLWLGFETDSTVKSKNSWETDKERDKDLSCFKEILIDIMEDLCNLGYISL